ncbi:lipoate-protein ligase B [Mangrovactinospora gilvigrisea]|uniref:Octanoyltransferase n=1 Tax=Mangrovactinospora gilvigrisea TaxID=1428644 RepID=A0A1J7BFV5_9ACTN|nr:lipoyl(octanoyl) transferase LipB [Mangrovactinospora gilvigrisea]OIV37563.1 lipoate-protein ligase B [Mangrovactinospora gilvigrisea]
MAQLRLVRAGFGDDAVPYETALEEQRRLHAARAADDIPDTALLLEHPPVYTAGRRTRPEDRPLDGTPVIDVDRGGEITWHGPGQLVGYPILRLPEPWDVVAYVRRLEEVLIRTCADLGLETTRVAGRSGVWVLGASVDMAGRSELGGLDLRMGSAVGRPAEAEVIGDPRLQGPEYAPSNAGQRGADRKLAAIGVRIAKGVTMHGFALNCDPELACFDRIVPCGIRDAGVASLSGELGRRVTIAEVLPLVETHLREVFEGLAERAPERARPQAADGAAAMS